MSCRVVSSRFVFVVCCCVVLLYSIVLQCSLYSHSLLFISLSQVSVIKAKLHEITGMPAGKQKLQLGVSNISISQLVMVLTIELPPLF